MLTHTFEVHLQLQVLGCSGEFVSRLSHGPYGASYGLLCENIGDMKWTY